MLNTSTYSQVELRVSRASITPTGPVDMGRPMIGPDVCLNRSYSRGVLPAGTAQIGSRPGSGRPAVTISDPLGGTLMLNPNSVSSGAASLGTRIQVGPEIFSYFLSCLFDTGCSRNYYSFLLNPILRQNFLNKIIYFHVEINKTYLQKNQLKNFIRLNFNIKLYFFLCLNSLFRSLVKI